MTYVCESLLSMKPAKFLLLVLIASLLNIADAAAQDADPACPDSQFTSWGAVGVVTPGDANNLRDKPSTSGALIGKVQPGEPFVVNYSSDPVCAEGYLWREIQTLTQRGWTVEIPADGDEPFIVPYVVPEPREVGAVGEDGSYVIEEGGIRLVLPQQLNIESATVQPDVGLFGDVMSAQPSSVIFTFYQEGREHAIGTIEIFPYDLSPAVYDYWEGSDLELLLEERPDLIEYADRNRMPQFPIAGVAALFGGAPIYAPFGSGDGLRYITYFAQDWVLFDADMGYAYIYRGISEDRDFLVAGRMLIYIPAEAIPRGGSRADDAYPGYIDQLEANLAALPTDAFTPDIDLLDLTMSWLTITDPEALLDLIP
jgi:hypothetical protein